METFVRGFIRGATAERLDIRKPTEADYRAALNFAIEESGDDDLNLTSGEVDKLAKNITKPTLGTHALGAFDGNVLVGIAVITRGPRLASWHTALLRLHVRPAYRRSGVGTQLLRDALDWADEVGVERVVGLPYVDLVADHKRLSFGPTPDSLRKVGFFEREGFELEGYSRRAARGVRSGTYRDIALLARVRD